jgi:hypothetical protein
MKPTRFEISIALIDQKKCRDENTYIHGLGFQRNYIRNEDVSQNFLQFKADASGRTFR